MAWNKPDFTDIVTEAEYEALSVRIKAATNGEGLDRWPFTGPAGFDHATVKRYCVDTSYEEVAEWQRVRLSMKGVPTHEKLAILKAWWDKNPKAGLADYSDVSYSCFVQVYNYLGALRRGGQLDANNRVRRWQ